MLVTRARKILGGLALAGTLALTGVVSFAQQQTEQGQGHEHAGRQWGRDGDGERGFGGPFARLNLTDAQKAQLKQIADRYRQQEQAQRQQSAGHERHGFDIFSGGTFDEAAVRAAAQARANAQVEREVAHTRMMYEMYNVLTPEQKAQLAAEHQQREQRRQEWRARRGAGAQQQQQ